MAVTLETAITNVRYLVDEPRPAYWSNTELTSYINEGCKDAARRAETKQTTVLITIIVGTQNYTMPTDAYRIHKVEYLPTDSTLNYTLEYRGLMEMDQIWGINKTWPGSYPLFYTLWKRPPTLTAVIYPIPQTPGKLHVYYYGKIVTAITTDDDIDILAGYEDMIYDYAAYRALRKDGNPMWKTHESVYESKLMMMIEHSRTFQDQANFFSTGQGVLPNWLTGTSTSG